MIDYMGLISVMAAAVGFAVAVAALVVATLAMSKVIGMEKSTHQIQYVPMGYEEMMDKADSPSEQTTVIGTNMTPEQKRVRDLNDQADKAFGVKEEYLDSNF